MGRTSHRSEFSDPKRGTKSSLALELLLRDRGVSALEAIEAGATLSQSQFLRVIARLSDDCGYDIRTFPKDPNRPSPKGRSSVVYKCVGRSEWGGAYHDYVAPKYAQDEVLDV